LDETKVKNALRFQFRQQFIKQLKNYLPKEITFNEPNNFIERRNEAIRHANYHIYTCTDLECAHLEKSKLKQKEKETTSSNNLPDLQYMHNYKNLLSEMFEESYKLCPKTENETWKQPKIDSSIFYINGQHEATFKKRIPTQLLDDLATRAEESTCALNKVDTNSKRRNYYFYHYLKIYQDIAAENHNLNQLNLPQAIDTLTTKIIDTNFLARVITYFETRDTTMNFPQIVKHYQEKAYPQAEKIIQEKFQIHFQEVTVLEDSLFLDNTPFQ
jgi:hypothetical protein